MIIVIVFYQHDLLFAPRRLIVLPFYFLFAAHKQVYG